MVVQAFVLQVAGLRSNPSTTLVSQTLLGVILSTTKRHNHALMLCICREYMCILKTFSFGGESIEGTVVGAASPTHARN